MTMLRGHSHKCVTKAQGRGFMLYDLQEDPEEQRNLIPHPDYADPEADLRHRLLCWLAGTQAGW